MTWALAAMEVIIISFVLPVLIFEWELTGAAAGLLGSATLFGMVFGNWTGGWLADRTGRIDAFRGAVMVYSVATALTAFSVGFYSGFLFRLLTGIGVGATATVATLYMSEHLPTDRRGSYLAYFDAFWAVGTIIAVVIAWSLLSPFSGPITDVFGFTDWRLMFIVASFPILLVPVLRRTLYETPFYLARVGRDDEAIDRVADIARWNETDDVDVSLDPDTTPETPQRGIREEGRSWSGLFEPVVFRRLIVVIVAWFGLNFGYFGVFIWLPDTVDAADVVGGIYGYLLLVGIVQIPGYLSAAYLVDRIGRKWTLSSYLLLSAVSTYIFAAAIPGVAVSIRFAGVWPFVLGMLGASFFMLGSYGAIRAYTPELFPTDVRGIGTGFAEGTGRIAGIIGPIVAGYLVDVSYLVALTPLAIALAIAGIAVLVFGDETKGVSLT